MEVTVAKSAGFCFGVKRAMDMVYQEIEKGGRVYTLGPLIHNEQVVEELEKKGVVVIKDLVELADKDKGTVIIRSHGVSKAVIQQLENYNMNIVDATCPFVGKIHRIVEEWYREGYQIVIIGSKTHPEVEGINGWCNNEAVVLETLQEAEDFRPLSGRRLGIVSQTTFNYNKFKNMVAIFEKKSYYMSVMNTICNATEERQTEAATIASQSDAMLVIGGKHSSNTQKLFEICSRECMDTYFIQTLDDLNLELFQSFRSVGITAGASTPNNIIKEVQSYVRGEYEGTRNKQ
jgi:4-hydroxy-3-methylbut-2-enyl diphosphate reductase